MTTWLQKQKKGELQALAQKANLPGADGLLKEDLVSQLDAHLRANSTTFGKDKEFTEFYARGGSPSKKPRGGADGDAPRRRRTTSVKVEPAADSPEGGSSTLSPTTPAAVQSLASRIRLPPSPSGVSDAIEAQTARLTTKFNAYVRRSGLKRRIALARQDLSSIQVLHLVILIFEAAGLRTSTLPFEHLGETPVFKPVWPWSFNVYAPNFFKLLTADFWGPTTAWLLTSFLLPIAASWVFNFTYTNPRPRSRKTQPLREYDPLTFSIVKGLLGWLVYNQGFTFYGAFTPETISVVEKSIQGGWLTIVIGSVIGIITAVYDSISFKS